MCVRVCNSPFTSGITQYPFLLLLCVALPDCVTYSFMSLRIAVTFFFSCSLYCFVPRLHLNCSVLYIVMVFVMLGIRAKRFSSWQCVYESELCFLIFSFLSRYCKFYKLSCVILSGSINTSGILWYLPSVKGVAMVSP